MQAAARGDAAGDAGPAEQVATASGRELTVIAPNRQTGESRSFGPGQDVLLTWDPEHTFAVTRQEHS